MKKLLLSSAVAAAMLFAGALSATAQTAYGLVNKSWYDTNEDGETGLTLASVDLSDITNSFATGDDSLRLVNYSYQAGTSVGDKYYAVLSLYDENSWVSSYGLYTINFTTGGLDAISDVDGYGNDNSAKDGRSMTNLAYDATNNVLYGTEYKYVESLEKAVTKLYKIDTEDGSLDSLTYFDGQYNVLVAKDGKLYVGKANGTGFWNLGLKLYAYESGALATDAAFSVESIKGFNSASITSSAVDSEGNIYLQFSTSVFKLDMTAQTATSVGTLSRAMNGITFSKSTEGESTIDPNPQVVEEDTRLLVKKTYYGSFYGDRGADDDSRQELYYYNSDNKLSRVVQQARGYGENIDYSVTDYTKYLYNEDGNLDSTAHYQTGLYDFGDKSYKLRNTVSGFEYDGQGRIITEPSDTYTYKYTYDEDGNIVTKTKLSYLGKEIQKLTYSDFSAGTNKPAVVKSTCEQGWTSYIYDATITYDENGNKVSEVRKDSNGKTIWTEELTYDGTFLTTDVEYTYYDENGTPISGNKAEYSMVDGDENKVKHVDYTYTVTSDGTGSWGKSTTYCIDEYVDFDGMQGTVAINDLTATISNEGVNNVVLKFAAPQAAATGCDFRIYRRGELIATKSLQDIMTEEYDEYTWMPILAYTDSAVYNNDYDYFVQPVITSYTGGDGDDDWGVGGLEDDIDAGDIDTGVTDTEADATGYNISNVASIKVALELPAVTDLKQSEAYEVTKETTEIDDNGKAQKVSYTVKKADISWTNPEYPEEYGFISNSLMFVNYQTPDTTTTDAAATSLAGTFDWNNTQVFILTRYAYGKALSDTITVDNTVSAIDQVSATDGSFTIDGRQMTLGANASVAVYSMSGKLEARESNVESMNLSALKPGAYIVAVSNEGKTKAYKVILK